MPTAIKLPTTRWGNRLHKRRVQYPSPGGPLSREQKARICIMARECFHGSGASSFTRQAGSLPAESGKMPDFQSWRREQQLIACGKSSLRECTQSDYLLLRAHFENLLGKSDRALETHLRAAQEPQRIAMMKLRAACADAGLDLAYPAKICRQQYKCELDEANANQLWRLVFTVRNRSKRPTPKSEAAGRVASEASFTREDPF
jgi:hypothetical protein